MLVIKTLKLCKFKYVIEITLQITFNFVEVVHVMYVGKHDPIFFWRSIINKILFITWKNKMHLKCSTLWLLACIPWNNDVSLYISVTPESLLLSEWTSALTHQSPVPRKPLICGAVFCYICLNFLEFIWI